MSSPERPQKPPWFSSSDAHRGSRQRKIRQEKTGRSRGDSETEAGKHPREPRTAQQDAKTRGTRKAMKRNKAVYDKCIAKGMKPEDADEVAAEEGEEGEEGDDEDTKSKVDKAKKALQEVVDLVKAAAPDADARMNALLVDIGAKEDKVLSFLRQIGGHIALGNERLANLEKGFGLVVEHQDAVVGSVDEVKKSLTAAVDEFKKGHLPQAASTTDQAKAAADALNKGALPVNQAAADKPRGLTVVPSPHDGQPEGRKVDNLTFARLFKDKMAKGGLTHEEAMPLQRALAEAQSGVPVVLLEQRYGHLVREDLDTLKKAFAA